MFRNQTILHIFNLGFFIYLTVFSQYISRLKILYWWDFMCGTYLLLEYWKHTELIWGRRPKSETVGQNDVDTWGVGVSLSSWNTTTFQLNVALALYHSWLLWCSQLTVRFCLIFRKTAWVVLVIKKWRILLHFCTMLTKSVTDLRTS